MKAPCTAWLFATFSSLLLVCCWSAVLHILWSFSGSRSSAWWFPLLGFIPGLTHTTCCSLCYLSLCYFPKVCCLPMAPCSHFYCSNISLSMVSHIYCRDDLGGMLQLSDTCTIPSVWIQQVMSPALSWGHNTVQTSNHLASILTPHNLQPAYMHAWPVRISTNEWKVHHHKTHRVWKLCHLGSWPTHHVETPLAVVLDQRGKWATPSKSNKSTYAFSCYCHHKCCWHCKPCLCYLGRWCEWCIISHHDDLQVKCERPNQTDQHTLWSVEKAKRFVWAIKSIHSVWVSLHHLEHVIGQLPLSHCLLLSAWGSCIQLYWQWPYEFLSPACASSPNWPAPFLQNDTVQYAFESWHQHITVGLNKGGFTDWRVQRQDKPDKNSQWGKPRMPEEKAHYAEWLKTAVCQNCKDAGHFKQSCPKRNATGKNHANQATLKTVSDDDASVVSADMFMATLIPPPA